MRLIVVLDCADADALADFWSSALGFRRGSFHRPYLRLVDPKERWPNDPQGNEFCVIRPPEGGYDQQRLVAEEEASQRG